MLSDEELAIAEKQRSNARAEVEHPCSPAPGLSIARCQSINPLWASWLPFQNSMVQPWDQPVGKVFDDGKGHWAARWEIIGHIGLGCMEYDVGLRAAANRNDAIKLIRRRGLSAASPSSMRTGVLWCRLRTEELPLARRFVPFKSRVVIATKIRVSDRDPVTLAPAQSCSTVGRKHIMKRWPSKCRYGASLSIHD